MHYPAMSINRLAQQYVSLNPSIKDCLKRGLINYSALAREICRTRETKKFDAALVACRRLANRLKDQSPADRRAISLIERAKITLKNKVITAIVEKPRDYDRLYGLQKSIKAQRGDVTVIEGADALVIVSSQEFVPEIKETFKNRILKLSTGLTQISMVFSEKLETTPGVVSFVYGLLAENNINVLEEMSCWTELMLVIDAADTAKAMKVLSLSEEI